MKTLMIVLATALIFANILLMLVIAYTMKDKQDKASKIGFSFMEIVYFLNCYFIILGVFV